MPKGITVITDQQKKEILELYNDPSVRIKDIAETYGVDPSGVCKIAKNLGASQRRPQNKRRAAKQLKGKQCPNCKKSIELTGAMFCPYCGTDIRSPKEMLVQRIESAMRVIKYLPEGSRDEMHKLFIDIRKELQSGGV